MKAADKYSPNLARWLSKNKLAAQQTVYFDTSGDRWIGYIDEGTWFIGCRLMRVLVAGTKAEVGCWTFPVTDLAEDVGFWDRYEDIGRCAIDERHSVAFQGSETRWIVEGDTRSCLWCNAHTQHLRRWSTVVEHEIWERAQVTAPRHPRHHGDAATRF